MAFSMDFRTKVVAAVQRGESQAAVARRFEVCSKSVSRWCHKHALGDLQPQRTGPRHAAKLTPEDDQILQQALARQPGLTLEQLSALLGRKVVLSTLSRRLAKLNLTLKKSR